MAKHPNKHYDDVDDDDAMESIKLLKERKAKIKEENEHDRKAAQDLADRKDLAGFQGLPKEGETRDQLLDRIRKMREPPPQPPPGPLFRSEGLQKEYDAEVAAGRAASAKKAEEAERYRALVQKAAEAEGEKNKL